MSACLYEHVCRADTTEQERTMVAEMPDERVDGRPHGARRLYRGCVAHYHQSIGAMDRPFHINIIRSPQPRLHSTFRGIPEAFALVTDHLARDRAQVAVKS